MDSQIIAMLQARDERAADVIRKEYGGLCYTLALRILGNSEDAEECVNDVLLAVWNADEPLRAETLRAYIASLARHAALDKLKARNRKKRTGEQYALALDELAEILPSDEQVEQKIEQRELTEALNRFLRTLPPDTLRLFMQRYYLSMPVSEIAEKNRMSTGAVKMALMRTRNKLKEALKKEGLL